MLTFSLVLNLIVLFPVCTGLMMRDPRMTSGFGDWTPASTTVCINQLSTPGARIELDMIAAYPRG
jgi:enamine deaminase RidA (YjgF/YER057c/UK114 family)